MDSVLSNACKLKLQNFEGPFDLLFHLIEKNKINIYDIPINEITGQYMDYLFAMREMDMEIASEFLVMASTLLHIKSRMLLPERKPEETDGEDPREQLIIRLLEYKKYKEFSRELKDRQEKWKKLFYKAAEFGEIEWDEVKFDLSSYNLSNIYAAILQRNELKTNKNTGKMSQIVQREKITIKSKIKEILNLLLKKSMLKFSEVFSLKRQSKTEVVTGFLAVLELAKAKKVSLEQRRHFSDIEIKALKK